MEPNSRELHVRIAELELENLRLRRKVVEREFDKMSESVQFICELTDLPDETIRAQESLAMAANKVEAINKPKKETE